MGTNSRTEALSICIAGMEQDLANSTSVKALTVYAFGLNIYLCAIVVITLHLQTLAKVHQAFVDLPCFCKRRTSCLRVARSFGT